MPEELKSCRVCKKDVAEYTSSCPHCGADHPADLDYSPVETKPDKPKREDAARARDLAADEERRMIRKKRVEQIAENVRADEERLIPDGRLIRKHEELKTSEITPESSISEIVSQPGGCWYIIICVILMIGTFFTLDLLVDGVFKPGIGSLWEGGIKPGIESLWSWVIENNIHIYLVVIIVLIYGRAELGWACMIVSLLLMFCGGGIGTLIAIPIFILALILWSSDGGI